MSTTKINQKSKIHLHNGTEVVPYGYYNGIGIELYSNGFTAVAFFKKRSEVESLIKSLSELLTETFPESGEQHGS